MVIGEVSLQKSFPHSGGMSCSASFLIFCMHDSRNHLNHLDDHTNYPDILTTITRISSLMGNISRMARELENGKKDKYMQQETIAFHLGHLDLKEGVPG